MRKLVGVILLFAALNASASEWVKMLSRDHKVIQIDKASVLREGNTVAVWQRSIELKPQIEHGHQWNIMMAHLKIDCFHSTFITTSGLIKWNDEVVQAINEATSSSEIVPDTVMQDIQKKVCN
jgi:hypothetical protein